MRVFWLFLAGGLSLAAAQADSVVLHLRNGDRLTGTIVSETTNAVTVLTLWQEKVAVPLGQIERREKVVAPTSAAAPPAAPAAKPAPPPPSTPPPPPAITKEMQQQLDDLLTLYEQDKLTPIQYQDQRAAVLGGSNTLAKAAAAATNAVPPGATAAATAAAKPGPPAPAKAPAAPVAAKKPKTWKVTINLGANATFNQTENQLYNISGTHDYVHGRFHEIASYSASYGQANGVTSVNNMYGSLKTDFDLGAKRKFFAYNLADGGYDQFRKIDLLYGAGPGMGYHLFGSPNKPDTRFILDVKAGGKYERFDYASGVPPSLKPSDIYLRLAENFIWHLPSKATLTEEFAFLAPELKFGSYQFHLDSALSVPLSTYLSLNLHVIDFYDTLSAIKVPHNSLQIISSLGITF